MRIGTALIAAALAFMPAAATAALPEGARAPDFTATGALAGRPFRMRLSALLRQGPVVLYFYPRAFTQGCTLEARAFSQQAAAFRRAGARVIGMSADDYDTLRRFSVEECRNAFPVATATPETIAAYDVRLREGAAMTNRTSYVIAPNGRIIYAHSDLDWREHVNNTLAAVRRWRASQRRR
jgi:thioredoxin-dependent peroxiredoxin